MAEGSFTVQSAKELWVLVSGRTVLKSPELVTAVLRDNSQRLLKGTRYFIETWPASSHPSQDAAQVKFLQALAEHLQVPEGAAYSLLGGFLLHEHRVTFSQLKEVLSNRTSAQALLGKVWRYYRRERLYALSCLRHIYTHRSDILHPYHELYDRFLGWLDSPAGNVSDHATRQLEDAVTDPCPRCEGRTWILYNLREQMELLHILLAYFQNREMSGKQLLALFQLFQRHRYGARQPFRMDHRLFGDEVAYLGFLEVLLILQGFRISLLLVNDVPQESDIFFSSKTLDRINAAMRSLGTSPEHGPIALAWIVVWIILKKRNQTQLAILAQKLKPFEYLFRLLGSSFPGGRFYQDLAKSIVFDLVTGLLSEYETRTIADLHHFYLVLHLVLENGEIAKKFWGSQLGSSLDELLRADLDLFPLRLLRNLKMLRAFASASKSSCAKVLEFMSEPRSFIEALEEPVSQHVLPIDATTRFTDEDYYPYGQSEPFVVARGTEGRVLSQNEENLIVRWDKPASGWDVCAMEVGKGGSTEVRHVSELVAAVLRKSGDSAASQMGEVMDRVVKILPRIAAIPDPDLEAVAACLQVAASCSSGIQKAWQVLAEDNLLPFLHSKPKSAEHVQYSSGQIGHLISGRECVVGSYPVCKAFLDLVLKAVGKISEQDVVLQGCLVYLLREIFPSILTFKFKKDKDRKEMLLQCLEILHRALTQTSKNSFVYYTCFSILHHSDTGKVIVRVVSTGEENLDVLYDEETIHAIGLALSVLIELPLMDLFSKQPEIVLTIAHYSFQRYSPYLARLALKFLKEFAKNFPRCLLAYFGTDAYLVKDQLLYRLSYLTEDTQLKVSLLEFLTACAARQPGILDLFVNKDASSQDEVSSCLVVVEGILKDKKKGVFYCPAALYLAAVEFIHALWARNQILAVQLFKQNPDFWALFTHLVQKDHIHGAKPIVVAHVLHTLALELFQAYRVQEEINSEVQKLLQPGEDCWPEVTSRYVLLQVENLTSGKATQEEVKSILVSWKIFLEVWLRCPPKGSSPSPDLSRNLAEQVLTCLSTYTDDLTDPIQVLLAETFLVLLHILQHVGDGWLSLYGRILARLSSDFGRHSRHLIFLILAIAATLAKLRPRSEETHARPWMRYLLAIFGSLNFQATLREGDKEDPRALCLCAISILIQREGGSVVDWVKSFKDFCFFSSLANLMSFLISSPQSRKLAQCVMCLYISASPCRMAAEDIASTGVTSHIILALDAGLCDNEALCLSLRLVAGLLTTLKSFFFEEALMFVMVLLGKLAAVLETMSDTDAAYLICVLVDRMAVFKELWKSKHQTSLARIQDAIGVMLNRLTAQLTRPATFHTFFSPEDAHQQQGHALLRLLAVGLSAFHHLATAVGVSCTGLPTVCSDTQGPALRPSFSPPSADESVSYGTLLYLISLVARLAWRSWTHRLALVTLEKSLHLAFTQSFLSASTLPPAPKFLFQREFHSEMLSINVALQRQLKKRPTAGIYQFLKVMCEVVEKHFE